MKNNCSNPDFFHTKETLQKTLVAKYTYIMCGLCLAHILLFLVYLEERYIAYFLIAEWVLFYSTWKIIKNRMSTDNIILYYFILTPLICIPIVFYFRSQPVVSCSWLIPFLCAAYIHFNSRQVIHLLVYSVSVILLVHILPFALDFPIHRYSVEKTAIIGTIEVLGNVLLTLVFMIYKDQLSKIPIPSESKKLALPIEKSNEGIKNIDSLFAKIQKETIGKMLFKDPEFNISTLSTIVKISNNYISKAIKDNGYINFSHYINFHRINYVKVLMKENDLTKVTLMYVYSEAGFSNQSTFNRVFKQFEGITPSEYIQTTLNTTL